MEFNNQIDQIKSELKYLDSEDRTAKFKREEDKVAFFKIKFLVR